MFSFISTLMLVLFPYFSYDNGTIHKSPWFQAIAGLNITLDGTIIPVGDTIHCYSYKSGIYSGVGTFTKSKTSNDVVLMFTIIYGDDTYTPELDGCKEGDTVLFKIGKNGSYKYALADSTWEHHEIYFVQSLTSQNMSCCKVKGDVDGQGTYDIGDLAFLVDHLFINYPVLSCPDCADLNDDKSVDVADLMLMVEQLFK